MVSVPPGDAHTFRIRTLTISNKLKKLKPANREFAGFVIIAFSWFVRNEIIF
jgi:hypothetical protein